MTICTQLGLGSKAYDKGYDDKPYGKYNDKSYDKYDKFDKTYDKSNDKYGKSSYDSWSALVNH